MSPAFWAFLSGAIVGFFAAFWLFLWLWGRMVPKDLHDKEIKRWYSECEALAADQCHHGYGTEWGHHRCKYQDEIDQLKDQLSRQQEHQHGRA